MPASIKPADVKPDPAWLMPDELWQRIELLLPPEKPKGKGTQGDRSNADRRRALDAIFFVEDLVAGYGYTAHIRSCGEEKKDLKQLPGFRARRWVVERTHSWMNRFRRRLIRWEKKKANYLAMLHLACAFITFHAAGVLG